MDNFYIGFETCIILNKQFSDLQDKSTLVLTEYLNTLAIAKQIIGVGQTMYLNVSNRMELIQDIIKGVYK